MQRSPFRPPFPSLAQAHLARASFLRLRSTIIGFTRGYRVSGTFVLYTAALLALFTVGIAGQGPRPAPRTFRTVSFDRPSFPIFATDMKECEAYRSEWQEVISQLQKETLSCAGANAGRTTLSAWILSCTQYFPEVLTVGGCRTYPACQAVDDQFWATLHEVQEETKKCVDLVALRRKIAHEEVSSKDQEVVDDLLTGSRSVVTLAKIIQALRATNGAGATATKLFGDYLKGFPASASTAKSQQIMQNALSDYLKAMDAATAQNQQGAEQAARAAEARRAAEAAAARARMQQRDAEPAVAAERFSALRAGPQGLSAPVTLECQSKRNSTVAWVETLFPGGRVNLRGGAFGYSCNKGHVWSIYGDGFRVVCLDDPPNIGVEMPFSGESATDSCR